MGVILSKFQKKPTTRDILQKIQEEIQEIEDHRWSTIRTEKNYASLLFFISLSLLVLFIGIFLYYLPLAFGWRDKILLSVPIFVLSLFVWLLKKTLQWFCRWSLDSKEARLRELQKEKGRILDRVQETETFNVATELLEKYDPKRLAGTKGPTKRNQARPSLDVSLLNRTIPANNSFYSQQAPKPPIQQQTPEKTQVYQQQTPDRSQIYQQTPVKPPVYQQTPEKPQVYQQPSEKPQIHQQTPLKPLPVYQMTPAQPQQRNINTSIIATSGVRGRPVRPILSKERTFIDKVVDWVVADGPTNRFALICKYCYGHNGMALQEEFETLNFRCCYCFNLNTTHKQRQIHDQLQKHQEDVDAKSKEQAEVEDDLPQSSKQLTQDVLGEQPDLDDSDQKEIEKDDKAIKDNKDVEDDIDDLGDKEETDETEEKACEGGPEKDFEPDKKLE